MERRVYRLCMYAGVDVRCRLPWWSSTPREGPRQWEGSVWSALRRFWKRPLYLDTWCGASSHRSGEVVCKTLKWEWITLKWECMVLLKWELAP